jgi:hypothetical protein
MHGARSLLLLMSGGVLVLSCGDNLGVTTVADASIDAPIDAPDPVDAAPSCDCPPAEPPLAGRFVVVTNTRVIPANGSSGNSLACPTGTQLITGSCTTDSPTVSFNMTLRESGFVHDATYWDCEFRNHEPFPVTMRVNALCLKPGP